MGTWKMWFVLGTFFVGWLWTPAWLACLVFFEFAIRGGRDVAAFWAIDHLHRGGK